MKEIDFIKNKKITIVGLGLIGSSFAMAIREKCESLVGIDNLPLTREKAISLDIFDEVHESLSKISPDTDILILATPVESILALLSKPEEIPCKNALVLDVGSTKTEILKVMEKLPPSFNPIGGHPICGKENLSIDNAEANLFLEAQFVLSPLKRTSETTRIMASQLIKIIGAIPFWISAEDHDQAIAYTSHVPYLTASALALAIPKEFASLISTGYRSTARLAATPSSMMLNVLLTNQENIVDALEKVKENIDQFITLISQEKVDQLSETLDKSARHHKNLISKKLDTTP